MEEKKEQEEAVRIENEKKRLIMQASVATKSVSPRSGSKSVETPVFHSVEEFYEAQKRAIEQEIVHLKKNGGKRIRLFDGTFITTNNGRYIYSFESDNELKLPDNTQISVWLNDSSESIPAYIVDCDEFTVIIDIGRKLGEEVSSIEFSSESWRLYNSLIERLSHINITPTPIVNALISRGRSKIMYGKKMFNGQDKAVEMSGSQPITFIWGPPGTGKTETLANIAISHMNKGYRVHVVSYSNVSVDGAVLRTFENNKGYNKPGKIIRYGYPKDKHIIDHDYLTSYKLVLKQHPELTDERNRLLEIRKKYPRGSKEFLEAGKRLTEIKNILKDEEKTAVSNASMVATTISKTTVDSILYDSSFDTVIFDEASMAYIPQILFSASLARKHFICMGDFAQLPPIVQSSSTNILNCDIFRYCGIVDAVRSKCAHEWLCMLDVQRRMHPEISDFSSITMYSGLLNSFDDKKWLSSREKMANDAPFVGDSLHLVDLSGMMSVCTKTTDQSRVNILSAFVVMGYALIASEINDVGIITPYSAQARLLHSMSRDIEEKYPERKKITCATVHQFQGSEKTVIIYDAVDCYRMQYPGLLLSSLTNDYANRLYNVAVTRAKGKMISVVNVDYMTKKKLSNSLIFRHMINLLGAKGKISKGNDAVPQVENRIMSSFKDFSEAWSGFIKDLSNAKKEVQIDIPGGTSIGDEYIVSMGNTVKTLRSKGVKVSVRSDDISKIRVKLRPYVVENKYITNPITVIDKSITWYGVPVSDDEFISEGQVISTEYTPIFRFEGKRFARTLFSLLEMKNNLDSSDTAYTNEDGTYNSFSQYVVGEIKCKECGSPMQLKKSAKGKFYLSCSNRPKCEATMFVETKMLESYFYHNNSKGKRCPKDGFSLEARLGKYGVYVCCCGISKHTFKMDEI